MSEEFSVFEELMNTMHSHYVQTMQKEMQKVLKKVHDMPTESWRERAISIVGNVVFELMMMDTKPNYCIVMNNSVDQTVYVSRYPSVSASNFEFKVQPGTRMQWLWGRGIDRLYFFAAGNANVFVQSYVSDFNPAAVNMLQTQSQIIANTVGNPVPTSIVGSLPNNAVQSTPIFNALAITDTANHDTFPDISTFSDNKNLLVYNSLNQSVNLTIMASNTPTSGYPNSAFTKSIAAGQAIIISSADTVILNTPLKYLLIRAACSVAPTSGSVSINLQGRVSQ